MILTGPEIMRRVEQGGIVIDPFNPAQVNPNSYNVRLHPDLQVYNRIPLDSRLENSTSYLRIPPEGLVLQPNQLYLGRTVEYTVVYGNVIPEIDGRSSYGRLGVDIHVCAGRGDLGFKGCWTLEIRVTVPVRIYPDCEIGQLYFVLAEGELRNYKGKYQGAQDAQASRSYLDWKEQ